MTFTLNEIANFCYEHRGARAFPGFTLEQVQAEIVYYSDRCDLATAADELGLSGVICVTRYPDHFYVHHLVCVRHGLATLINYALRLYPGYTFTGLRRDEHKHYTQRNLLWAIKRHQQTNQHVPCSRR